MEGKEMERALSSQLSMSGGSERDSFHKRERGQSESESSEHLRA